MPSDFKAVLRDEIDRLEAELSQLPTYRKLAEAKRLYALYTSPLRAAPEPPRTVASSAKRPAKMSPERQLIIDNVCALLEGKDEPTKTAKVFDQLSERGIEVPGNEPKNNLSAMLSNSDLFTSHGRSGWTLTKNSAGDAASEQDTPPADNLDPQVDFLREPRAKGRVAGPGGGT